VAPPAVVVVASPLSVAVAGCGVVGRAFLRAAVPAVRAGVLRIVSVSDRGGALRDPSGLDPMAVLAAKEAGGFGRSPGAGTGVFVDLTTGNPGAASPDAFPLVAALREGRDVVTANKSPLALFPAEVEAIRRRSGARLRASATVAGGVPILELLGTALRGSGILEVAGAWNATSTFVLSRVEEGASFDEALEDARRLGFAEADATADLDGRDAAAKASIVAGVAFGLRLPLGTIERAGIGDLDPARIREAARRGRRTRLVARVTAAGARVGPETLPEDHPLAAAAGESAVSIRTALAGTVSLRGPGAGGPATASAVLNDCLSLAAL
jgi:homoserine dehydrogenase